jgi:hypothetical protein
VITGYVVTPFVGVTAQPSTEVGNVTQVVMSGLANGTSYTFQVRARNAIGDGPASAPSGAVTPATLPDAPANVTAVAGNAQATVSWAAPASDGGSAITGYVVTPFVGAAAQQATLVGPVDSTSISGLANGTTYTFSVVARNTLGDGPSTASNAVTPTAPFAPPVAPPVAAGAAKVGPAKPKAGWAVIATVSVAAGGTPVKPTWIRCAGTIGKTKLKGTPRAAAGSAKCTYRTPRSAKGKTLKGVVSLTAGGKSFTRRFSIRLR